MNRTETTSYYAANTARSSPRYARYNNSIDERKYYGSFSLAALQLNVELVAIGRREPYVLAYPVNPRPRTTGFIIMVKISSILYVS